MIRIKSGPTPVSGRAETEQLHVIEKLLADAGMMPCWHRQLPLDGCRSTPVPLL